MCSRVPPLSAATCWTDPSNSTHIGPRNFSRFRYRNTELFDPNYVNYLVTQMGVPKRVQDELRARLLPVECDADINRIFIHTEGSVRAPRPAVKNF